MTEAITYTTSRVRVPDWPRFKLGLRCAWVDRGWHYSIRVKDGPFQLILNKNQERDPNRVFVSQVMKYNTYPPESVFVNTYGLYPPYGWKHVAPADWPTFWAMFRQCRKQIEMGPMIDWLMCEAPYQIQLFVTEPRLLTPEDWS